MEQVCFEELEELKESSFEDENYFRVEEILIRQLVACTHWPNCECCA